MILTLLIQRLRDDLMTYAQESSDQAEQEAARDLLDAIPDTDCEGWANHLAHTAWVVISSHQPLLLGAQAIAGDIVNSAGAKMIDDDGERDAWTRSHIAEDLRAWLREMASACEPQRFQHPAERDAWTLCVSLLASAIGQACGRELAACVLRSYRESLPTYCVRCGGEGCEMCPRCAKREGGGA